MSFFKKMVEPEEIISKLPSEKIISEDDKEKVFRELESHSHNESQLMISQRPEDEEEIRNAIEGIKKADKKPSIFKSVFSRKHDAKQAKEQELKNEVKPESTNINSIKSLIKSARGFLLDMKLDEAKRDYIHITEIYNRLNADEQKKVYKDIKELYDERKSAESLNLGR